MLELAQNILDIAENSIRAGAKLIGISVIEDSAENLLTIAISDDGCGMKGEEIKKLWIHFIQQKMCGASVWGCLF